MSEMQQGQQKRRKEFSPEREARTTAAGLWRYADEYRQAAETVQASRGDVFSAPAMYLATHAVELGLKAFLRSGGHTLAQLKDADHDLQALYGEAMRRHLKLVWRDAPMIADTIRALDEVNRYQAMRYIINGKSSAPKWWTVSASVFGLLAATRRYCLLKTFGKVDADRMIAAHPMSPPQGKLKARPQADV